MRTSLDVLNFEVVDQVDAIILEIDSKEQKK